MAAEGVVWARKGVAIGSCPCVGEYSCETNPVNPRSAMACMMKR